MRIAFTITKQGSWWLGGVSYMVNLLSVLSELPGRPLEPVLFHSHQTEPDFLEKLRPYLSEAPISSDTWTVGTPAYRKRLIQAMLLQRDIAAEAAFKRENIDLVFQSFAWYGIFFSIPTLAWIGDFQHKRLPHMFGRAQRLKRELGYRALIRYASRILVSSEAAGNDCRRFFPAAEGKLSVLPFAVKIDHNIRMRHPQFIREKYSLPEKFFFLPNQFWKHKNHLGILEALKIAKERRKEITVVATGNLHDNRDPEHIQKIRTLIKKYDLAGRFIILGSVPYSDIGSLMRASAAVLNSSLFEGWSTTVEEAKSIGVPLLLSDIEVHREQNPQPCRYFDPHDPVNIYEALARGWEEGRAGPHTKLEEIAEENRLRWRKSFGENFLSIAEKTVARHQGKMQD